MNIVYATRATIPFASAASLNTVQMCQSLVELGHDVTLVIGRKFWRPRGPRMDWHQYYGFQPQFQVHRCWELPKTSWHLDAAILRLARRRRALLYSRYPRLLAHRSAAAVPTLLEIHADLVDRDRLRLVRSLQQGSLLGVVVITTTLRDHLLGDSRLAPFADRFVVAADAVNVQRFADVPSELDLQQLGYVGSLFPGKGMERIVEIAELRPKLTVHVFGGRSAELRRWSAELQGRPNLRLWGPVPPASVPECFRRFGIALLPNQPSIRLPNGDDIGRFTSPMKLFEYMAAGRAIIASDLPALREVLTHKRNCLLVAPEDPRAWSRAIDQLRAHPELAHRLARQAKADAAERHSYHQRFRLILDRWSESVQWRRSA